MGDNDEVVHAWEEDRPCCNSQFNCWHARPCAVNGPTGIVSAINMRLTPYRWCCESLVGYKHWAHCKFFQYFGDGQAVTQMDKPFPNFGKRYRIEEPVSVGDRTFENETKLNPRKARRPRSYDNDWLF